MINDPLTVNIPGFCRDSGVLTGSSPARGSSPDADREAILLASSDSLLFLTSVEGTLAYYELHAR
jgi:hypothetical protein